MLNEDINLKMWYFRDLHIVTAVKVLKFKFTTSYIFFWKEKIFHISCQQFKLTMKTKNSYLLPLYFYFHFFYYFVQLRVKLTK